MVNKAGAKDETEAKAFAKARLVALAAKDNQWLAKETLLGDRLSFRSSKFGDGRERQRMTGGLGEMEECPFQSRDETDKEHSKPAEKVWQED